MAVCDGGDVLRGRRVGPAVAVVAVLAPVPVAVAVGVPVAVPAAAGGGPRAAGRELPLSSFGQLLVDPVRERVYVSGGGAGDAIAVLDFSGAVVATLTGHPGASGMALHRGVLYVALPSVPAIGLVDADSLRHVSRVLLPPDAHPWDLAEAGGRLWFQRSGRGFGSMDLASLRVDLFDHPAVVAPRFATAPGDPGLLLVADGGAAPPTVHRLDLAASPFAVAASRTLMEAGSVNDLRVDPRGTTFGLAAGAPYEVGGVPGRYPGAHRQHLCHRPLSHRRRPRAGRPRPDRRGAVVERRQCRAGVPPGRRRRRAHLRRGGARPADGRPVRPRRPLPVRREFRPAGRPARPPRAPYRRPGGLTAPPASGLAEARCTL